jgi:hypothetical protein
MNDARGKRIMYVAVALAGLAIPGSLGACSSDDDSGIFLGDDGGILGTGGDATIMTTTDSGGSMMVTGNDSASSDDANTGTGSDANGDDAATDASTDADSATSDASPTDAATDAGKPGLWALTDYCGSAISVSCPSSIPACGTPVGGLEATACVVGASTCLAADVGASTLHRLFSCLPSGHQAWDVNGLCSSTAENCSSGTPPTCSPNDSTVFGTNCDSVDAGTKCTANNQIWACLPSAADIWMFDGYCGVGSNAACGTIPVCTVSPVVGAACPTPRAQCVNNGDKIFVCAPR